MSDDDSMYDVYSYLSTYALREVRAEAFRMSLEVMGNYLAVRDALMQLSGMAFQAGYNAGRASERVNDVK